MSTTSIDTRAAHRLSLPRPLQLVDAAVSSSSTVPSPLSPSPNTPRTARHNPRRQSSISYYPSDHTAAPKRSNSLGGRTRAGASEKDGAATGDALGDSARACMHKERRGTSSLDTRGALTLTEKHADLLHFIAQKEARCLELRAQLATHEAELAALKRRWERIVARGMDRAYGAPSAPARPQATQPPLQPPSQSHATKPQPQSQLQPRPAPHPRPPGPRTHPHAPTQSTSSVSTASTAGTADTRLSQSSASSLAPEEHAERLWTADTDGTRASVELSMQSTKALRRRSGSGIPSPSTSTNADTPLSTVGAASTASSRDSAVATKRKSLTGALPPAALIPGILTGQWMESVGTSVGRRWEELQRGETFTKSQKRASVMLADVSQSFFSALSPPLVPPSPFSGSSPLSATSSHSATTTSPLSAAPPVSSLLDDAEDNVGLGGVLVPDISPSRAPRATLVKRVEAEDDDDDWNW